MYSYFVVAGIAQNERGENELFFYDSTKDQYIECPEIQKLINSPKVTAIKSIYLSKLSDQRYMVIINLKGDNSYIRAIFDVDTKTYKILENAKGEAASFSTAEYTPTCYLVSYRPDRCVNLTFNRVVEGKDEPIEIAKLADILRILTTSRCHWIIKRISSCL
jgi:hypothetical protein